MSELHLMLDLETLSVRPTARIIEIGWATFDPHGVGVIKSGSVAVDVGSQSGSVDAGTVDFWLKQPDGSRLTIAKAKKLPVKEALEAMDKALGPWGAYRGVWSHGPAFDVTILQNAYDRFGRSMPWDYKAVRDTRTLAEACKVVAGTIPDYPREAPGASHTGEADSINQAVWVQAMYRVLASYNQSAKSAEIDPLA
jgi:hypothetical protein